MPLVEGDSSCVVVHRLSIHLEGHLSWTLKTPLKVVTAHARVLFVDSWAGSRRRSGSNPSFNREGISCCIEITCSLWVKVLIRTWKSCVKPKTLEMCIRWSECEVWIHCQIEGIRTVILLHKGSWISWLYKIVVLEINGWCLKTRIWATWARAIIFAYITLRFAASRILGGNLSCWKQSCCVERNLIDYSYER